MTMQDVPKTAEGVKGALPESSAKEAVTNVAKDLPKGQGAQPQGSAADAVKAPKTIEQAPSAAHTVAGQKLAYEK